MAGVRMMKTAGNRRQTSTAWAAGPMRAFLVGTPLKTMRAEVGTTNGVMRWMRETESRRATAKKGKRYWLTVTPRRHASHVRPPLCPPAVHSVAPALSLGLAFVTPAPACVFVAPTLSARRAHRRQRRPAHPSVTITRSSEDSSCGLRRGYLPASTPTPPRSLRALFLQARVLWRLGKALDFATLNTAGDDASTFDGTTMHAGGFTFLTAAATLSTEVSLAIRVYCTRCRPQQATQDVSDITLPDLSAAEPQVALSLGFDAFTVSTRVPTDGFLAVAVEHRRRNAAAVNPREQRG